jgi:hypothetical protein
MESLLQGIANKCLPHFDGTCLADDRCSEEIVREVSAVEKTGKNALSHMGKGEAPG